MSLNTECTKTHGTSHEVLNNRLYRLYIVDRSRCRSLLPFEKVTYEYRTVLLVNQRLPLLIFIVVACSRGNLQTIYRFWVPRMFNAVITPRELTVVLQAQSASPRGGLEGVAETYLVSCYLLQSNASNGAHLRTEIPTQQVLAKSDTLENLCTSIRANGRDTHLRHNLLQTLIHCPYIVRLSSGIFLLYLSPLYQIIKNGKCHIWT